MVNLKFSNKYSYCYSKRNPENKVNCVYVKLSSIELEKLNIEIPIPQQCYDSLQYTCPLTNNKEQCLNCLIKNKDLLNSCSASEEEEWCNKIIKIE